MYGPDIPNLKLTSRDPDGTQHSIDHDQIQRGDLVEVSVQLDIEIYEVPPERCRTSVYLSFNRVVRVLSGDRLREVSTRFYWKLFQVN